MLYMQIPPNTAIFWGGKSNLQSTKTKNKKSASYTFFAISSSVQISNQKFASYNNSG